eukprot:XP_001707922.1 Hypothetical protein GL50803_26631 [Giardia lamblia ATCC 50803]
MSVSSAWALSGVSPQLLASRFCPAQHRSMRRAPRDRVQGCSVAQLEEGLDAAPQDGSTLARQRPSAVGVRYVEQDRCAHQPVSPCAMRTPPCAVGGTQSARSRGRPMSGSPGGSGLPCGAHHDRPPIALALSRPWEEGRTRVLLLPAESLGT